MALWQQTAAGKHATLPPLSRCVTAPLRGEPYSLRSFSRFIQTDGIFHKFPPVFFGKLTFFSGTLAFFDDCTII